MRPLCGYITEKPKLTKDEKSFLDGLDPSWTYMLRNGRGQLYLARKVESMYGNPYKYLYLEGIQLMENLLPLIQSLKFRGGG